MFLIVLSNLGVGDGISCFLFQTDKTMAELEIDINMRIREWDVIQAS